MNTIELIRQGQITPDEEMQDFSNWWMASNHCATRGGPAVYAVHEFLRGTSDEVRERIWARYQIEKDS